MSTIDPRGTNQPPPSPPPPPGTTTTPTTTGTASTSGAPSSSLPGGYAGYQGNSATPGQDAAAVCEAQIGIPYYYGGSTPSPGFDCSGLLQYCYLQLGIDITRDTTSQWNNNTTMKTIMDVSADAAQAQAGGNMPPTYSESQLQAGDCLYYFQPGNSGPYAHCMMYIGAGQCIQAPQTGQNVGWSNGVFLTPGGLGGDLPFRGAKRVVPPKNWTAPANLKLTGPPPSQGTNNNNAANDANGPMDASYPSTPPPDPRSNLPFSAFFQGQIVSGVPTSGSLAFSQGGKVRTAAQLVRGGMVELKYKQFRCYFMMNPQEIDVDSGINTNMLSPFQLPADIQQYAGSWVTNQTISFTLYFNRMFEVWQGNIHGPNGGPGPSDEGCRWDIRALERLMGIFDAQAGGGTLGNNGWGSYPAQMMPLQVVFGGPNSFMFQGMLNGLSTYYTIFDTNMIPVEAYAEVQIMRMYEPNNSQKDLISPIITGATGSQPTAPPKTFPKSTLTFNAKAGGWSAR